MARQPKDTEPLWKGVEKGGAEALRGVQKAKMRERCIHQGTKSPWVFASIDFAIGFPCHRQWKVTDSRREALVKLCLFFINHSSKVPSESTSLYPQPDGTKWSAPSPPGIGEVNRKRPELLLQKVDAQHDRQIDSTR